MSSQAGFLLREIPDRASIPHSSSLFTIVAGIFGTCHGSPPDTTSAKYCEANLFKWYGLPQRSFFLSSKTWSSRLECVFLFPLQLPDSYSHRLAG